MAELEGYSTVAPMRPMEQSDRKEGFSADEVARMSLRALLEPSLSLCSSTLVVLLDLLLPHLRERVQKLLIVR